MPVAAADSWTQIASYGSGIEADMACATLQSAGIPFRLKGDRAGVFGLTFQGTLAQGLALMVPAAQADEARDLLGLNESEE